MCYNYEYMIERGVKRSIRDGTFNLKNLSELEKTVLGEKITYIKNLADRNGVSVDEALTAINDTDEVVSSFPGQQTLIIPITTQQREAYLFGFLPDWSKSLRDSKINYNCRSETILEKPTWKKAFSRSQRCLVPATAFYETDRATKKRHRFTVKDSPEIFYAGLFNHWTDKETGEIHKTFAIITCEANELVRTVWERMPVILNTEAQKIWMNTESSVDDCAPLLTPFPPDLMECKEAPALVRKKKTNINLDLGF